MARPDAGRVSRPPSCRDQYRTLSSPSVALTRQVKHSGTLRLGPALLYGFLQVELDVVDVGELDQEAAGAAAAVLEVDLLQALGGDVAQLLLGGPGVLGVEECSGSCTTTSSTSTSAARGWPAATKPPASTPRPPPTSPTSAWSPSSTRPWRSWRRPRRCRPTACACATSPTSPTTTSRCAWTSHQARRRRTLEWSQRRALHPRTRHPTRGVRPAPGRRLQPLRGDGQAA